VFAPLDPVATPPRASVDARASVRRAAAGDARLSIGHNPTLVQDQDVTEPDKPSPRVFKVWKKGARADFPGIPNEGGKGNQNPPSGAVRGDVLTFSRASRLNLMRTLATVETAAVGYTMALTLPGRFEHLSRAFVKRCFLRLCDQFTAKAAKDPDFREVSFFWKQELQKRGAIHFHLLLYGITNYDERSNLWKVQKWIAHKWNELVAVGISEEERHQHLAWHRHHSNFDKVANIHGYFAKYLGKDEADLVADEAIPGRWWGRVNSKAIPFAVCSDLELPPQMAVYSQRIARRIRQKRADAAKHRAQMKKINFVDCDGNPTISQFGLLIGLQRKTLRESDERGLIAHAAVLAGKHHRHSDGYSDPVRFGRFALSKRMRFAGVKLVGVDAPALSLRILRYAGERFREWLGNRPF
jgi:hypothetical protein